jgi:hypothetical protein
MLANMSTHEMVFPYLHLPSCYPVVAELLASEGFQERSCCPKIDRIARAAANTGAQMLLVEEEIKKRVIWNRKEIKVDAEHRNASLATAQLWGWEPLLQGMPSQKKHFAGIIMKKDFPLRQPSAFRVSLFCSSSLRSPSARPDSPYI